MRGRTIRPRTSTGSHNGGRDGARKWSEAGLGETTGEPAGRGYRTELARSHNVIGYPAGAAERAAGLVKPPNEGVDVEAA